MAMRIKRCLLNSTVQYIREEIDSQWEGISTVLGFKFAKKEERPLVCIDMENTETSRKEIGSTDFNESYLITIDIWGTSRGMAYDIADFIKETIKSGFPYYEYSHESGNYESLDKIEVGRVKITSFLRDEPVTFGENEIEEERFRHTIAIQVRVGKSNG